MGGTVAWHWRTPGTMFTGSRGAIPARRRPGYSGRSSGRSICSQSMHRASAWARRQRRRHGHDLDRHETPREPQWTSARRGGTVQTVRGVPEVAAAVVHVRDGSRVTQSSLEMASALSYVRSISDSGSQLRSSVEGAVLSRTSCAQVTGRRLQCGRCKKWLERIEFSGKQALKGGRFRRCKACMLAS